MYIYIYNYNQQMIKHTAAKHVSKFMKNMCLPKGNPCKNNANIRVF